jgi:hypothetical protein
MSVITIRKAQREGARLVIGIAGISGSGKTYTALQLSWGLANYDASKVGLLDTENRRGSLYADILKDDKGKVHPFLVGDMDAPFSPRRYVDAILEFQKAGVEVLVVDSVSHEWEGTGGCEEIAHAANPRLPDWATAKREHKAFMNALLQSNMHIIVCIRAREKVKISKVNGKTEVEPIGIQPVCEKNFMFEMTASMMMWSEGMQQETLKCPAELRPILARGKDYITAADGVALRRWVDGAKQLDPDVEHARNTLRTVCEGGMDAYREAWGKLPKKVQRSLVDDGSHDTLKASAEEYDRQRTAARPGGEELAEVNNAVMGNQQ